MPNSGTNKTKKKLERSYICSECDTSYTTSRYSKTHYCSPSCRSKARSQRTASKRIEKLPVSNAWLWVATQCSRAGTVEILQDVDLEKLFSIYNYRQGCYDFCNDSKKPKFHICHISPVAGNSTIGLLHHENLFIGGSLPNQVQGNKSYKGAGKYIQRINLKKKWLVSKDDSNKKILAKVQKYLGQKLIEYAKKNQIKKAARFTLAERIIKLPENKLPLAELQRKGAQALRELEAELLGKNLYTLSLTAKRSLVVYVQELERFASYDTEKKDDYLFVAAAARILAQYLVQTPTKVSEGLSEIAQRMFRSYASFKPLSLKEGKDIDKLRDFIAFTAFNTLQGAEVDRALITNTLRSYLQVDNLSVTEHIQPDFDDTFTDRKELQAALDLFYSLAGKVKDAFAMLGMLDSSTMLRINEKEKAESFKVSFIQDMQCPEYYQYDYSDYNIQVEAAYSLPPLSSIETPLPF